jgi:hypothetical protein
MDVGVIYKQRLTATLRCGWFSDYLFRPGGAYSISICRIALFTYLFVHVYWGVLGNGVGDPAAYYHGVNLAAYYPKGLVWLLFPSRPPPNWVISTFLWVTEISTILGIVGFLTRVSMVVSVLSCCFLGAFIYSWEPLWSHPYNGGLLAGLGFMFGRAGDTLSVDSLLSRLIWRRSLVTDRPVYWWPIILGMFGTAAVYFGGFYAKWSTTTFTYDFSWVFSDNLRNAVSLPWLIYGRPLPWQVALIANHAWLWKLCAAGHLVTQAFPILAMFSLRKPYVRLAEGCVFAAGTFLLREVMGFWNPQWIILTAFFIDWEFFLAKARLLPSQAIPARPVQDRYLVMGYAAAFMLANLVVIGGRLDDDGFNRAYPFSSMNFYSNVSALKPYDRHRHYPFSYGELLLRYPGGRSQKWFCYPSISSLYAPTFSNSHPESKLREQLGAIRSVVQRIQELSATQPSVTDCAGNVDIKTFDSVDLFASILDIPPYPEKVRFEVGFRALVGRYERDRHRFIAAAGGMHVVDGGKNIVIDVDSSGLDVKDYSILLADDPWQHYKIGPLIRAKGVWTGHHFKIDQTFYLTLAHGWYPIDVRVTETTGNVYDFFGGILYR